MNFLPPAHDLALFTTAAIVLLLIPGPAVLYIVARSIDQGRAAGLASAAGIATGTLVHVVAASAGLSALLLSSAAAFSVVKYTGTAYLFYLGMKKFRERPEAKNGAPYHVKAVPTRKVFAQGTMVNVLNPKTALFFFAFLPQFVSPSRGHVSLQFFTLGMIFALMGWASDSMWAVFAGSAASWLRGSTRPERAVCGRHCLYRIRLSNCAEWHKTQVASRPRNSYSQKEGREPPVIPGYSGLRLIVHWFLVNLVCGPRLRSMKWRSASKIQELQCPNLVRIVLSITFDFSITAAAPKV